jgi:hypothetical protein
MNLMLNGIEAMKDKGGALTVASARAEDGGVLISVTDSGVGFPAGESERIFEAFQAARQRHGAFDQPADRRVAWRASVGEFQSGTRRDLSVHLAGRNDRLGFCS